ncbi:MAG: helicase-exonuclease AddAB subunit AddA [Oscillospiraceae bacterium]|nr:helicase-exonuclease AddAB subunit AddA [Oscillospiraceae bacterium]
MINSKMNLTTEQQESVNHRGGALLVSAAAGSGKTKVLVERLLSHINDGANIDEFMVITYTRAAAFELRERIHEELLTKLSEAPGNKRLRRQALLCRGAAIDTIHTVCSDILRENSHLVRLPPDFRIADTTESMLIMSETADKVIGELYDNIDANPGFKQLIDTVAGARDDKQLVEFLLDIYNKIRSLPDPGSWLNEQINKQNFEGIKDISDTDYGAYTLSKMKSVANYVKSEVNRLCNEMEYHPDFKVKYSDSVNELESQTDAFLAALESGWDEAGRMSCFVFSRAKSISGYDDLKEIRKKCIAELKKCTEELKICSKEHIKEMESLSPAITALLNLLKSFDSAYSEEKKRRGAADFSDLEHLTLSLLVDETTKEKTTLAHTMSKRYKEIMIDEYQDVNAVQEQIFNAISDNNKNIFMVGDVKQAIYRFRHADPTIFLSKYKSFKTKDEKDSENNNESETNNNDKKLPSSQFGRKIHLSQNFRSRRGILDTVNYIFTNIMSVDFGELEYTKKEHLIHGRSETVSKQGKQGIPYHDDEETADVSVDLLDMSTLEAENEDENPTAIKIEAEYIASKIQQIANGSYYITGENGEHRPAVLSDIVILLRSMKNRAWQYAAALSEKEIPSELPGGEGYFDTIEISAALSLLSVIDNPLQDISMASVLSGPIYKFTSDELAEIRVEAKGMNFYEAVKKSAEHNKCSEETSTKCKEFLIELDNLRAMVYDMSADRFIWHVYNSTGLLGIMSAMKGGEKRRQNLIQLAESAGRFEKTGYKGLFGFLLYIRAVQERDEELPLWSDDKSSSSIASGSVKIMSIHKSKGLEFPIVFLANVNKSFNYMDMNKSAVFHSDLGIGTMFVDKSKRIKYSTLARNAIRSKLRDEMYSEELRVLYVALTRAREKLFITAAIPDAAKLLDKINFLPSDKISSFSLMSMRSILEWLLTGLRNIDQKTAVLQVIDTGSLFSENEIKNVTDHTTEYTISNKADRNLETEPVSYTGKKEFNSIEYEPLKYPYKNAVDLPSKLTVTGLTKLADPESEAAKWVKNESFGHQNTTLPGFLSGKREMTGAERGTLLHNVMQHIDRKKSSRDGEISNELQRMAIAGIISEDDIKVINKKQIADFFSSNIGGRLINAKNVQNEFRFSLLNRADSYFPGSGTDLILIQGVIDCFFEENNELVIIDYKSDKVSEKTIFDKIDLYTPQLDAYAKALERITEKKVKEKLIYFFEVSKALSV